MYEIITVPADMDIRCVARLNYRAGIRRAQVEDKGEIVTMISLGSLILDNELFKAHVPREETPGDVPAGAAG